MNGSLWILDAGLLLAALGLSAMFAGIETGIYTLNRVRLALEVGRARLAAMRLLEEIRFPNRLLATLLIGNACAHDLGSMAIAHMLEVMGISPLAGIAINACILLPLIFVFGETLPKELFRVHTDRWTYSCVGFLRVFRVLFSVIGLVPLITWLGSLIVHRAGLGGSVTLDARQRFLELFRESSDAIGERQVAMADRVMQLGGLTLSDVMTPWKEAAVLHEAATPAETRALLRNSKHSTYPLVDRSNRCVGVISAMDVLVTPEKSPHELMRTAIELPRSAKVSEAIRALQERGGTLVVVRDGERAAGVASLRDMLESVVGSFQAW
ncbi:MAG: CNNM domain-containing protein [Planctomycetes bacterium]|nr:CNNM domain-containing protein [Planctomycetota bacterium]